MVKPWYRLPREAVSILGQSASLDIYSTPSWTRCWSACCSCPCSEQGVGWGHLQRHLPTWAVLCDSMSRAPLQTRVLCRRAASLPPLLCYRHASIRGRNKRVAEGKTGSGYTGTNLQGEPSEVKIKTCRRCPRKHRPAVSQKKAVALHRTNL